MYGTFKGSPYKRHTTRSTHTNRLRRRRGSPYRRHTDEESGGIRPRFDSDDEDPFSIARAKHASVDCLRRWRQAALVLNASRRYRYTLDLKKEEEKQQTLRKIRAHPQAIRAGILFREAGPQANGHEKLTAVPSGDFAIGQEQLSSMTRDHNNNALQQFGGLLWVNLIMDTLGALALATEPPTDHLMHKPPVGRREPLVTNIMWRNLLIQAVYQLSVLFVLNFRGKNILNLKHGLNGMNHANKVKNTLIFNSFVICQIFNEFNARKPDEKNIFKGITKNRLFMGIVALTIVLQIIIIEFLGKFTSTTRLNWKHWIISVVIGFISWPLGFLGKFIPVPETPLSDYFNVFKIRHFLQRNTET